MSRGYTTGRMDGPAPTWILAFTAGGRDYLLGTAGAEVSYDGAQRPIFGELGDVGRGEEAEIFNVSPTVASLPLEFRLPAGDAATLYARGLSLTGLEAELSLHFPGDTWEDRIPQVVGRLVDIRRGSVDDPVRCTLESAPTTDDAPILRRRERIGSDTWSDPGSGGRGNYYARVYGQPGPWTEVDGTKRNTSGSVGFVIDDSSSHIGIGLGPVGATGSTVTLWNETDDTSDSYTVEEQDDALGQTVAYVNASSGTLTVNGGHRYAVRWDGGTGLKILDGTESGGLGDLISELLSRWPGKWDRGRFEPLRPMLNGIEIACFIDDPGVNVYAWLQANVLSMLPLGAAMGPEGLYFVPFFLSAQPEMARAHLRAGQDIYPIPGPAGQVASSGLGGIINTARIKYALRARTGEYQGEAAVVGEEPTGNEVSSARARRSVERYGVREKVLSTDILYKSASALQVLHWQIEAFAEPIETVLYALSPRRANLGPGDTVLVTHPDYGFSARPCTVLRKFWQGGYPFIALRLNPLL